MDRIQKEALEITLIGGTGSAAAGEGDLQSMLTAALDGVVELCDADHGMILLFDLDGTVLAELARDRTRYSINPRQLGVTEAVLDCVRRHGYELCRQRAPRLEVRPQGSLRHLVAVSVPTHDPTAPCGLVYLARKGPELNDGARHLVEGVAQLVAVAASRDTADLWRWRCVDVSPSWSRRRAA